MLCGAVQAQLGAAEAREAALGREQEIMQGALTGQVTGVMDMMKGLRVSLSIKLSESQSVCQALAQELAAQKAKNAAFERCWSCVFLWVWLSQCWKQMAGLQWLDQKGTPDDVLLDAACSIHLVYIIAMTHKAAQGLLLSASASLL